MLRRFIIPLAMIVAAVTIGVCYADDASIRDISRYIYIRGDRSPLADVERELPSALSADSGFMIGYSIVLAWFAWNFRRRAFSRFGRTVSGYVCVALAVMVIANVGEDLMLWLTESQHLNSNVLLTAIATAATVKWCAALLAIVGIPATVAILWRDLTPHIYRRAARDEWWKNVLADPELPIEVSADSAQTQTNVAEDQWRWLNAYNVPGAMDVIKRRERDGKEVQAICLSGGGVRAAWVAMGAMQSFSEADPLNGIGAGAQQSDGQQTPNKPRLAAARGDPRLVDEVDYVISVSGGSFTAGARLLALHCPPPATCPTTNSRLRGRRSRRRGYGTQTVDGVQASAAETSRDELPPAMAPEVPATHQLTDGAEAKLEQSMRPNQDFPKLKLSQRFDEGSVEFHHFRRGSSYIADSPAGLIRALVEVLRNLVASLVTVFIVPVIVGWVAGYLLAFPLFTIAAFTPVKNSAVTAAAIKENPKTYFLALVPHPAAWWATGFFAAVTALFIISALFVEWRWPPPDSEKWRVGIIRVARGSAAFTLLVFIVTVALPALIWLCSSVSDHAADHTKATAAAITGVVGLNYLSAIVAIGWKNKSKLPIDELTKQSRWRSLLPPGLFQMIVVLATLAVLVVVWLVTLGSFAAGVFAQVTKPVYGPHLANVSNWGWWLVGLVLTALFVGYADVTSLSLHPFFRLRLARTFAVRRVPIQPDPGGTLPQGWQAERYPENEWTWLHQYGRVPGGGPRFVFAAAATLSGEAKPSPGSHAVSYVLSADHIGGPELGWLKTGDLWDACAARIKRDLTVEASMAISGAGFASATGLHNTGYHKLLTVSGARLGTWLPNPNFVAKLARERAGIRADPKDARKSRPSTLPTIRGAGYLYRELLGINHNDGRLVHVTDGRLYESLGLVEALRRRCRLILCIDGGADGPPLLGGLASAMRRAEYELGVKITLDNDGPYSVHNIAPGSGEPFPQRHALAGLNDRITKGTVVVGRITYPPAAGLKNNAGKLIFAKAVLWESCPNWLLTYAATKGNEVFPRDPTADEWSNEEQFAAYTTLGRIIAHEAVRCAAAVTASGFPSSSNAQTTPFRVLARVGALLRRQRPYVD